MQALFEHQSENSLEKHPEHPDVKTVQTLEAQTENVKTYFSERASLCAHRIHPEKE